MINVNENISNKMTLALAAEIARYGMICRFLETGLYVIISHYSERLIINLKTNIRKNRRIIQFCLLLFTYYVKGLIIDLFLFVFKLKAFEMSILYLPFIG